MYPTLQSLKKVETSHRTTSKPLIAKSLIVNDNGINYLLVYNSYKFEDQLFMERLYAGYNYIVRYSI